jgi:hypothetical protein
MKITKNKLKQIIKEELEELDDASAHTIATGGETIERPKMPTGFDHYAGKGRYEDSNTAGSGDRAREEDLESIRVAGDIGEKPEPQQRWDISDETGVPVLRSDLDDALTSLSKDQVEQIIREAVSTMMSEQSAYGDAIGQEGGHGRGPNMHQVDSEFISKETGGTGGFGDEIQDNTTVVSDKDTFRSRQRSSRGTGKLDSSESDTSLVDNTGKRQSSTYRNKGDVSFDSFKQTPAGGSRAKASSKNPLGLGKAKGAFGGETLKKGGKQLNIGDEGYMNAFADVGMPGIPEAGEDDNLIADLNETFKRWKKLIK